MTKYDPKEIEPKWQKKWLEEKVFWASDASEKPKYYQLETFPYPSAAGLHVGHPKGYIAEDIHARYMRMCGHEVLYTMGWDAFGLPTENYAIKVGKSPKEVAEENTKNFKRQVQMFGLSYDWDREINTSLSEYYKWTQWLFSQLFKKGLAYRAKAKVNWCPKDQTVLANEQVVNGKCERCGSEIEERDMEQWFLKITDYADRLLDGLKGLDWPASTVKRQEDWIGKSDGAEIEFPISGTGSRGSDAPNFLILHGYTGRADKNFLPWLTSELEQRGFKVQTPQLPNTDKPEEAEQVDYVLKNCTIDHDTIIIGHSLGGVVAMKALQKYDKPIKGLVLVAPAVEPKFRTGGPRPFWNTFTWDDLDYEKIKKLAGSITVLSDLAESHRKDYLDYLSEKLGAVFVSGDAEKEHFTAKTEPMILRALMPSIRVFTTRPDTLFGATYIVLAPEHPIIKNLKFKILNWDAVERYVDATRHKTDLMRQEQVKEKTGVELKGVAAVNPATKEEIPIWIADYVLGSYGTGAIMAVPAHDERDFEFAKKFNLPVREVVAQETGTSHPNEERRDGGCGVIFDPKTQKYAVATHPDGLVRLFAGGVEKGEGLEQGVLREITEESGLCDFGHIEKIRSCFTHYYNRRKGVHRSALATCFLVVLESDKRKERKLEAHEEEMQLAWMTPQEIVKNWNAHNENHDVDHWLIFLREAVARAIELGEDKTNAAKDFPAQVFLGNGRLVDSGEFSGMDSATAKAEIIKSVQGERKTQYRLRDWSVSRQRYWGAPIPMVHCGKCGIVPVPDDELPVRLPDLKDYRPRGMPPLASSESFMNVPCPQCGGPAKRDPETLDTFVDSSWYYLRYADPHNAKAAFKKEKAEHWLPVDLYVIGAEHTVLHLLYSRFITKFLHDEGWLKFDEPFLKLRHLGLIRGADGQKMSKSKGNVVNPDEIVNEFGADSVRLYEMFMGPFEDGQPWDPRGILGVERFLKKAWNFVDGWRESHGEDAKDHSESKGSALLNKTIKKVGEDIASFEFNTAISSLMIFLNGVRESGDETRTSVENFLKLLHPFAPHMAQELWSRLGHDSYLDFERWPEYDPKLLSEDMITIILQVNGKTRDTIKMAPSATEEEAKTAALANANVKRMIGAAFLKKVIYVDKKLVNVVI